MKTDVFGYPITVSSTDSAMSWNAMIMAFLAHGATTPAHLMAVIDKEPHFAMAFATKGLMYLMLGRRELVSVAQEALVTARTGIKAQSHTAREISFVDALGAWLNGRPTVSIAHMEEVLKSHPEDALAMKIGHAIRFILGDAVGMRASLEAILPSYDVSHAAQGYILGCHSFSLEETGEYKRAESAARLGISIAPDDAWGLHALTHVHDMTGNSRAGLDWLNGREEAWAHCNNFRYHVWWHKALMHLDQGEIEQVLHLYDQEIRKDKTDDYRDISNATSLLSRLELDGIDVGDRWEELADFSQNRTEDGCLIFADLHYMLALVGGGRNDAISNLMGRMQRDARNADTSEFDARVAAPGLAMAAGLEAFGEGDYQIAFLNLSRARQTAQLAGGSHAQRDVFERLTIDAGIRGGFFEEAETILCDRTVRRAGKEDRYAAVRMEIIAKGRGGAAGAALPAE